MGCVTMTYNAPLKKYLMCVTDGGTTGAAFQHLYSWNPTASPARGNWWRIMRNFGEQAYFVNIPSKFISADGRTLWLCYSANFFSFPSNPPGSRYAMCLREIRLVPIVSKTESSESEPAARKVGL